MATQAAAAAVLAPLKEFTRRLFMSYLDPYVENLNMNLVSIGVTQGAVVLRDLRVKKSALDKLKLPIEVLDGRIGYLSLNLHWLSLGNTPVELVIEDLHLLVASSLTTEYSVAEDERRAQALKFERLDQAEALRLASEKDDSSSWSLFPQAFLSSLVAKALNNFQVSVKNIHIRYEDAQSNLGHPFAAGFTLASFSARSTDANWKPAFVPGTAGSVHKLANLESLAVYFDTDCDSLRGLPQDDTTKRLAEMISRWDHLPQHQFLLKPVTGEGRVVLNRKWGDKDPQFEVELLFDEIGFNLDHHQYRDAISMADMYHVYMRQHQYRKYRPDESEFQQSRPKALLKFAGRVILEEVHDKNIRWTWEYFRERRDDRRRYVELFKFKVTKTLTSPVGSYGIFPILAV